MLMAQQFDELNEVIKIESTIIIIRCLSLKIS